jgi:DNA invertase Pin-like site-specific DNA recombinase
MLKIDRLARSTSDLYRIISELTEKVVSFKVVDDPAIDTTSRTGKFVMEILALIAEFENDIQRERQMDGIAKAKERGVKFGRKREADEKVEEIRALREAGDAGRVIIKRTGFSKASIYRNFDDKLGKFGPVLRGLGCEPRVRQLGCRRTLFA